MPHFVVVDVADVLGGAMHNLFQQPSLVVGITCNGVVGLCDG
ncbi:MAG: hypothetical protein WCP69_14265 [Bacteroidota bacterium]